MGQGNAAIQPKYLAWTFGFPLVLVLAACAAVGVVVWVYERIGAPIPLGVLTRDVAAVARVHPLTGALSQIGLALWAAAAGVAGFNALRHWRHGGKRWIVRFHAAACVISAALLIDDAFMVHEHYGRLLFGLNEKVVLGILGGAVLVFLGVYRRFVLTNRALPLLICTCLFFAVMLVVDQFQVAVGKANFRHLLEDGMKLLGIVGWLAWLTCCGLILDGQTTRDDESTGYFASLAMATAIQERLRETTADFDAATLSAADAESGSETPATSDRSLFDHLEMPHDHRRKHLNPVEERTQSAPQADDGA
ncbi:MAG: hypothetical protein AAF593_09750 [Planctomycetota bacterium]